MSLIHPPPNRVKTKALVKGLGETHLIEEVFAVDPHSPPPTISSIDYARLYIQQVFTEKTVRAPNTTLAGKHFELLNTLYSAHSIKGNVGAKRMFDTMAANDPQIATLVYPPERLLIPIHELEHLPLPRYAIERYPIYEKGFNLMYGKPGCGKSLVALDFAGHFAATLTEGGVAYVAAEGREGLYVRWAAWQQHNQRSLSNVFVMLGALAMLDSQQISQFVNDCKNLQIRFIVVDTLARSMVGQNENDTTAMGLFVDAVDHLRQALDCGILFIHHTNKLGTMRGSTALDGALDSVLKIEALDEQQIGVYNSLEKGGKNKDREEAPPIYLNKLPVTVTVRGNAENAVVVELSERVIQTPSKDTLKEKQRRILETLDGFDSGLTVKDIIDATQMPQSTAYEQLKRLIQANFVQQDKERYTITAAGREAIRN